MYRFNIIKLRTYILPGIFLIFTICLILFSSSNIVAAKNGLNLWANSVVPSLFPFFVATELLSKTDIPRILGKFLNKFMKPIFNVSGEGAFALIMGLLSGYPVGAKIAVNFRNNNILPKEECERLLSFTNNSGPLFILGTIGISMFGNFSIGLLLFMTHILACLSVGFLFRYWKYSSKHGYSNKNPYYNISTTNNKVSFSSLGDVLSNSITSAISTILMIGGFVVIFSVIISIFLKIFYIPNHFLSSLLVGMFEITSGISLISSIKIKKISLSIIASAFLLGLGGISILLQVFSITSKSDLSIKPYILGKLMHGIFAAFYTFLFLKFIPVFNLNL